MRTQEEFDLEVLWRQWKELSNGDSARWLRQSLDSYSARGGSASRLVRVKMSSHSGQTIVHAAARFSRPRCLKLLVEEYSASPDSEDDQGFTPLLAAAWSHDNVEIVDFLVQKGARLDVEGIPPLTSSCGGKGPFTAMKWASRKGHMAVCRYLKGAISKVK